MWVLWTGNRGEAEEYERSGHTVDCLVLLGGLAVAFGFQVWPGLAGACRFQWITRQGATCGIARSGVLMGAVAAGVGLTWMFCLSSNVVNPAILLLMLCPLGGIQSAFACGLLRDLRPRFRHTGGNLEMPAPSPAEGKSFRGLSLGWGVGLGRREGELFGFIDLWDFCHE